MAIFWKPLSSKGLNNCANTISSRLYLHIGHFAGTSLSVILHLNIAVAIVSSATVAIVYTMFGHMIAVAYTDIVQLMLIVFGLVSTL